MPTHSLLANGVGTLSWILERDSLITGVAFIASAARVAIISYDPAVTFAQFNAPAATGTDKNIVGIGYSLTAPSSLTVPVSKGEVIFVAFSGAGTAVIFYEDNTFPA